MYRWPECVVSGVLLAGLLGQPVLAQTAEQINETIRNQQLDIRQEQDRLQREKRQRELENEFKQLAPPPAQAPEREPEGPCFDITAVTFQGLDDLPKGLVPDVERIARPYLDRCLALAQLSDLVEALNRLFLNRGLVTTRAFLPEQSLTDGELRIRIVVGKVQGYRSDTLTPRNLRWAFPLETGDVLNLRDIEQGLDQINRLRSNSATIDMIPGDVPGQTVVGVRNTPGYWLGGQLSVDGNSIQQGDDYRGRVDVYADDLLGVNDALIVNGNQSLAQRATSRSYGYGLDYSVPWRYYLFTLSGNQFRYENVVQGTNRTFTVSGESQVLDASLNRTLYRGQSTKLDGLVGLATKKTNNYIEDARIDVSSRQLTIARLEVRAKRYIGQATTAFASLTAEHGLRWLGADDDRNGGYPDTAQFQKYRVYAALNTPLWQWNLGLTGQYQYSPDRLPFSEQAIVASSSLMAGFGEGSLAGDSGGWLMLDAGSPYIPLPLLPGFQGNVTLSLMKGWIPHRYANQAPYGSASAAQLAFRAVGRGFSLALRVGKQLEPISGAPVDPDVPDVGMTLAYSL